MEQGATTPLSYTGSSYLCKDCHVHTSDIHATSLLRVRAEKLVVTNTWTQSTNGGDESIDFPDVNPVRAPKNLPLIASSKFVPKKGVQSKKREAGGAGSVGEVVVCTWLIAVNGCRQSVGWSDSGREMH